MAVNRQDWGINMSSDTAYPQLPGSVCCQMIMGHLTQYGVMLPILRTTGLAVTVVSGIREQRVWLTLASSAPLKSIPQPGGSSRRLNTALVLQHPSNRRASPLLLLNLSISVNGRALYDIQFGND